MKQGRKKPGVIKFEDGQSDLNYVIQVLHNYCDDQAAKSLSTYKMMPPKACQHTRWGRLSI